MRLTRLASSQTPREWLILRIVNMRHTTLESMLVEL